MRTGKWEGKAWESCKEIILADARLKEIDAVFYDLLDAVESNIATKLEETYLDYAARAIELAYLKGRKDTEE